MKIFVIFSLFLVGQFSLAQLAEMPYLDQNYSCVTSQKADTYIKDFNIKVQTFGGAELCNNNVDTKKLFNDLQIIENGKYDSTKVNPLIRGYVDLQNYYGWMKSQTRGIKRGNDVPTAVAYNQFGYFTMQDGWSKSSTLGRVGTVIHEARHTDGYKHVVCDQGTYQDTTQNACDTNYNYGGSHAVEMEYYARVAVQGLNFHPVYKKMARLMAMARANIFFNTPVMARTEAVMLLRTDMSKAEMIYQNIWINRELPASAQGELKRTSFGAVIFNGTDALTIDPYKNSGYADPVKDVYSYFKMNTNKVKDFEEFDQGSKRYVVKLTENNEMVFYAFSLGTWASPRKLPFNAVKFVKNFSGSKAGEVGIVADNGDIYLINAEPESISKTKNKWDFSQLGIAMNGQQKLILNDQGQVIDAATGLLWTKPENQYKNIVNIPIYNAFTIIKQ